MGFVAKTVASSSVIVPCALFTVDRFVKYEAQKAVRDHKIKVGVPAYNFFNNELYAYAVYGIVKDRAFTTQPGTFVGRFEWSKRDVTRFEITDDAAKPIGRYLYWNILKSYLLPITSGKIYQPLKEAQSQWQKEELSNGDLGHVSKLDLPRPKQENLEKIAYYTEAVTQALILGFTPLEIYGGPNPRWGRIANNGGIIINHSHGEPYIMTPLGRFVLQKNPDQKPFNKSVTKIEIKPMVTDIRGGTFGPMESVVIGTEGQTLPVGVPLEKPYPISQEKWEDIRDDVFMHINARIKDWD